jgi:type IV pilus assembly protein PilO
MTLDDIKNINVNDLGSWPLPIKVGAIGVVGLIIFVAGYFAFIDGEWNTYQAAQRKEEELRETFLNKKAMAINLPAYKQQMEEMQQTFGSMLRQLPNSTEVPDLLVDITQAGLGRGLEFVLFKPEKETRKDFYAELPISVEVHGSYHELASFVSDVAALPRIVTFGDITISSSKGAKLSMAAKARTYRYMEDGSSAAAAQQGRAAKRGPVK